MSAFVLGRVLDQLYGPLCASCGRARTRNPSKTCSACLGRAGQLCHRCNGTGAVYRPGAFPDGCGACAGTGVRRRS